MSLIDVVEPAEESCRGCVRLGPRRQSFVCLISDVDLFGAEGREQVGIFVGVLRVFVQ